MTDAAFARAFDRGEVAPADFDHRAHMRVAWVYLRESPSLDAAVARMRAAIKRFAAAAGKSDKYHETITVAWMILLSDARARVCTGGVECELEDVVRQYPALAGNDALLQYYSRDRLFGDRARQEWIEPDVAPLYCARGRPHARSSVECRPRPCGSADAGIACDRPAGDRAGRGDLTRARR